MTKMLIAICAIAGVAVVACATGVATSPSASCASGPLPDHSCTPGDTDPRVTQANIHSTICVEGWTATIRPSLTVSQTFKTERMHAYGVTGPRNYELDHLIPLELGGASTTANLWPEPWQGSNGAKSKDKVENRLNHEVCDGEISLAQAQQAIASNWQTA